MRITTLCLTAALAAAASADWTVFRGAAPYDGPQPAADVSAEDAVKWSAELDGRGLSAPLVVGDKVFVTTSGGLSGERLGLIAFDKATGERLWTRQLWATGRTVCHEKTCNAAPSPASDGERIFTFYSSGDAAAYDLDGNLLWYRGLGRDFPNASNSLGMSSSLVVADGVVVCMLECDADSRTFGLDATNGETVWNIERPRLANWTSPVVAEYEGRPMVLLQSGEGLTAVDPQTGETVWQWDNGASTVSSPTVAGDVIVAPADGLTAIKPGEDAESVWSNEKMSPATVSPVVVGDAVLSINRAGVLGAADLETGERSWQQRLKGPFSATPVVAGDLVFAVSEGGLLQVVRVSEEDAELVGERDLGETVLGTPALDGGALYVRSDDTLWRIGG